VIYAKYAARRIGVAVLLLFAISALVFFLFAVMPGDYFSSNRNLTPERLAELRSQYGLDKGILQRYVIWLGNAVRGDFGYSLQYNQPVTSTIAPFLWKSFLVAAAALVISWTVAVAAGVYAATRQYSWFDRTVTVLLFISLSVPSFFLGLILIKVFALDLHWFPTGGMTDTGSESTGLAHALEVAWHMVLPVGILVFLSAGSLTRYIRSGMLDTLRSDFIRTARAKGLKERTVVLRHGLRNTLIPAITLLAFELPGLFSGAIITEQVFNWPGIGQMQLQAVQVRDYEVLMTITILLAALTILANLIADLLYSAVDPRVRLVDKEGSR
jgi:peptide/nickel transport system permease protein